MPQVGVEASFAFFFFILILAIAIMVGISRWIFRINDIIKRLDSIINALKIGFDLEDVKKKKN
ncbi:MAG: hypothetical protein FJ110_00470 [Deltaproteobacteria bacterium]|nr:hypothetical protein [Deltaproteobacteria bacterium]